MEDLTQLLRTRLRARRHRPDKAILVHPMDTRAITLELLLTLLHQAHLALGGIMLYLCLMTRVLSATGISVTVLTLRVGLSLKISSSLSWVSTGSKRIKYFLRVKIKGKYKRIRSIKIELRKETAKIRT